ncbi:MULTISPECIES: hypothetical protein [Paraburkholderia]|jgi:hypothetical protein|uniref:hypothetical protein n=1 Tax=Paraburkholderia TaxID=1822464 RepID=UPI0038B728E9
MNEEFLKRLPAIIAACPMKRARSTGEMTIDSAAIRRAALDTGYTHRISRYDLAQAMTSIGAASHTKTSGGRRYRFPDAMSKAAALDSATAKVQRTLANHKEN